MKVVVVGLGSMGKRRIRLLKQNYPYMNIVGVDSNEKRCDEAKRLYKIMVFQNLDEVCGQPDIIGAFVCTSPETHSEIILKFIKNNINVFTEINLSDNGYEQIIKANNVKVFLSSTFLYRKDIKEIIKKVNNKKANYIYHTGQYLPDWHPWENYKDYFVNKKETNGCREILAIELPWIIKCFGEIINVNVMKNTLTNLKLDYSDNYMIQVQHKNGSIGMISVDVVSRSATRRLEIYNEEMQLRWDGSPESLQLYDCDKGQFYFVDTYDNVERDSKYNKNIVENAYGDEIKSFFKYIQDDNYVVEYDYKSDKVVQEIITNIEG